MYHATPIGDAEGCIALFSISNLDLIVRTCLRLANDAETRGDKYGFTVTNDDGTLHAVIGHVKHTATHEGDHHAR